MRKDKDPKTRIPDEVDTLHFKRVAPSIPQPRKFLSDPVLYQGQAACKSCQGKLPNDTNYFESNGDCKMCSQEIVVAAPSRAPLPANFGKRRT